MMKYQREYITTLKILKEIKNQHKRKDQGQKNYQKDMKTNKASINEKYNY